MEQKPKKMILPIETNDASSPLLDVPFWDSQLRQLHYRGECIKSFQSPAENQELILTALQQAGWTLIPNPLLPDPSVDRQRQLQDAVRRLNGHQHPQPRLRFHVCNYGQSISWEPIGRARSGGKRKSRKEKRSTVP